MHKKIIYILPLLFFVVSCESLDSVKRGLTGQKENSTDEFLIKKKDPLVLPPDFEDLPLPDDLTTETEEISNFEKALETAIEETSPSSGTVEQSILKKIRKK